MKKKDKKNNNSNKVSIALLGIDLLICAVLIAISSAMVFFNLGDMDFPQTAYFSNEPIFIDFGQMVEFDGVVFLNSGGFDTGGFRLYAWDGGDASELFHEETRDIKFRWLAFEFNVITRYMIIEPATTGINILEMGFISNNKFVAPAAYDPEGAFAMFDESWLIPENPSYMNGMNFDETVHALTAYNFIHSQPPREWTHPPLGKSIIALGINMFGMTPFGWRFMSALFGSLMIIAIYVFGKRMFDTRYLAFFVLFVFAFDFMRFVQARVATLDTFLVTFIVFMYLFMFEYTRTSFKTKLAPKSLACLALSGIFMGLAISVKWQGVFAGLGLGVLFALAWRESRVHNHGLSKGLFTKYVNKTLKWCILFFFVVPAAIYCLSYIPFAKASGLGWFEGVARNQADMLNFHTYLAESNDYQSRWWTWPLNLRPMYYYRLNTGDGSYRGINTFGNPTLWWGGFLALVWCAKRWIADKDKTAMFLCVAWMSQILPWVFISRSTFIYHYFPCVPFLVLMIAHFIKTRAERRQRWYAIGGCALVFILFVVFYPVLSGMVADVDYISLLEWLPGWDFLGIA
jgi:dolichyl-phosphate-mannose--protein O-mannosyl transferase